MILTQNHGPLIVSTNYWGSWLEGLGLPHLTLVDSTLRMLLPRGVRDRFDLLLSAREIVVTIGQCEKSVPSCQETHPLPAGVVATEILCTADWTASKSGSLYVPMECWDKPPAVEGFPALCEFTAWEHRRVPHRFLGRRCHLRRADLPCLAPIKDAS